MSNIKSTDPKSFDVLRKFTSTVRTKIINNGTNDIRVLVNNPLASETSPMFQNSSKVNISLNAINISEMNSETQQNIFTDCGSSEYSNKTDLERSFYSHSENSEMSEEIRDKSKNEFNIFSEYIKHETNANSEQYSENKNIEYVYSRNSQEHVKRINNLHKAKICKKCLIPYFGENCGVHKKPDIIVEKTRLTSISATNKINSYALISTSKSQNHSVPNSKFRENSNDISKDEVLKTSAISKEDNCSLSSFMERISVNVSKQNSYWGEIPNKPSACAIEEGKVVGLSSFMERSSVNVSKQNSNWGEIPSKPSACVIEEGKVVGLSNCLLEEIALDSDAVFLSDKENERKKYFCPHCSKCFGFRFTLERHIRSHNLLNALQGNDSEVIPGPINKENWDYGKSFKHSYSCVFEEGKGIGSLKDKTLHTLVRENLNENVGSRHVCSRCSKCFRFRSTLERHILSHNIKKITSPGRNSAAVSEIIDQESPDCGERAKCISWSGTEKDKRDSFNCLLKENLLNSDTICPNSEENEKRNKNKHVCPLCSKCFIFRATLERHVRSHNILKNAFKRRVSIAVPKTIGIESSRSGENYNISLPVAVEGKETFSSNCLFNRNFLESNVVYPTCKEDKRNKHTCPYCSKYFRFPSSLKRHIRSHNILVNILQEGKRRKYFGSVLSKKRNVNCDLKRTDILKRKLKLRTKKYLQKCPYCSRTFEFPSKLVPHFEILDEPPYTCHLCLITFSERYKFSAHIQCFHRKAKQYFCDMCKKIFRKKSYFKRHIQIHIRGKPFFCGECGRSYSSSNELSFHICSYDKCQHQCVVCGKCFQKKTCLIRHYLFHSYERPYPCKLCNYRAKQSYLLTIHVRRNHKNLSLSN